MKKNYNLHLRTGLTLAPWQYYSYTFATTKNWSEIRAPLNEFKKSNFYQPKSILGQKIKSVGATVRGKNPSIFCVPLKYPFPLNPPDPTAT